MAMPFTDKEIEDLREILRQGRDRWLKPLADRALATIDKDRVELAEWRKIGKAVRVAACGVGHSMGSRMTEIEAIVKKHGDANIEIARLKAKGFE